LNLGRVAAHSLNHAYTFSGTLTLNQDTNNGNDRVLYQRGQNQTATFSGAIVDDTNATHTGTFPLHIATHTGSGNITFTGANSYSHGTSVMYESGEGNAGGGLVVQAGSSLGTGPVTVQGIAAQSGALLTLNASGAVRNTLTIETPARSPCMTAPRWS
jgi:autotransporter-associated beta strand protein